MSTRETTTTGLRGFCRARFRVVKAVHFTRAPKKYEKIGAPKLKFGKIKPLTILESGTHFIFEAQNDIVLLRFKGPHTAFHPINTPL